MIVYLVVMESLPDKWMSFFSRLGICVSSQAKSEQGISEACCSLAVGFATSQQSTCAWPYGPLYKAHVASWYLNLTSEPVLWHLRTFRKIEMQVRWGFFFFFFWRLSPFHRVSARSDKGTVRLRHVSWRGEASVHWSLATLAMGKFFSILGNISAHFFRSNPKQHWSYLAAA